MNAAQEITDGGTRPEPLRAERELKFTLPESRAWLARLRLDQLCRRDSQFPAAFVWSIYYDTPELDSLGEKINSDYLKQKVRVRWYADLDGRPAGPVFVEAKMRVGTHRWKVRVPAPIAAADIPGYGLQDSRLRDLPAHLRQAGVTGLDAWRPFLLIRYRRDRFVDPISRARVSLDAEISAAAASPRLAAAGDPSPLGTAVLEVKGAADELPRPLTPLLSLGLRQQSFSKYLAVYGHLTARAG